MQFAMNNTKLPAPQLSLETFDAIHDALLQCATDQSIKQSIRDRCLELLMSLAVTRGSLSYFLTGQSITILRSHSPIPSRHLHSAVG